MNPSGKPTGTNANGGRGARGCGEGAEGPRGEGKNGCGKGAEKGLPNREKEKKQKKEKV